MSDRFIAKPGLEGVVAGDTKICCVDQGKLLYRGYAIADLAEQVNFEHIAHLLIHEKMPDSNELQSMSQKFFQYNKLPSEVVDAIRGIPKDTPMMDVLRTGVSMCGHFDPVQGDDVPALKERAIWLLAVAGSVMAARFRLLNGHEPIPAKEGLSHAAQILYQCHGEEPDATSVRLLDLTLILYAEHEFNASTFTTRVICSTTSDMISAIVGAIGALKGPLHGGANERAMELIARFSTADEASAWVKDALARKEKVMGFGHRVYKNGDHRAHILEKELRVLASEKGRQDLIDIYDAIKDPIVNKGKTDLSECGFPLRTYLLHSWTSTRSVHTAVRMQQNFRLGSSLH